MSRSRGVTSFTILPPIAIVPARELLQAGDEPQRGRLAAAGGADEDQELAVADLEREVVQRSDAFREPLRDVLQPNVGHRYPLSPVVAIPRMKYRWAKKNSSRTGIMLITFAAISRFGVRLVGAWKVARPSWIVMLFGL